MSKRDYYEVLEIDRNASEQEIKRAYRKQAVKYHPDKNAGNKAAEENFKEAAEAYSILGDAQKRAQYDRFGHSAVGGQGGINIDPSSFSDFGDIFGDFFGFGDLFGSSSQRRSSSQRGSHLRYDLSISFTAAVFELKTKIKVPRMDPCQDCSGSGAARGSSPIVCPTCEGHGQVRYQQGFFSISKTCHHCQGSGKIIKDQCKKCRGSGRVQTERVLEIKIPAGIDNGQQLRIPGAGEAGSQGGPSGDLLVVLSVGDHEIFERQEQNVFCSIPIDFPQAALGAKITVPTLEGKEIILIPAGTQSGSTFRLKGKGIPKVNGRGRGDQYVSVNVTTPKKLTSEQRKLFEQLSEISPTENKPLEKKMYDKVKDIFG